MPVRYYARDRSAWKQELFLVDGKFYTNDGHLVEHDGDRWRKVIDASLSGYWRYHRHYDRDGYCDNPGRGY